jgi:hypothetical protein
MRFAAITTPGGILIQPPAQVKGAVWPNTSLPLCYFCTNALRILSAAFSSSAMEHANEMRT